MLPQFTKYKPCMVLSCVALKTKGQGHLETN